MLPDKDIVQESTLAGRRGDRCLIIDLCKTNETYKFTKNMHFTADNTPKQV